METLLIERFNEITTLLENEDMEPFYEEPEEGESPLTAVARIQAGDEGSPMVVRFELYNVLSEADSDIGLMAISAFSGYQLEGGEMYTGVNGMLNKLNRDSTIGHLYIDEAGRICARYSQMVNLTQPLDEAKFAMTLEIFLVAFDKQIDIFGQVGGLTWENRE